MDLNIVLANFKKALEAYRRKVGGKSFGARVFLYGLADALSTTKGRGEGASQEDIDNLRRASLDVLKACVENIHPDSTLDTKTLLTEFGRLTHEDFTELFGPFEHQLQWILQMEPEDPYGLSLVGLCGQNRVSKEAVLNIVGGPEALRQKIEKLPKSVLRNIVLSLYNQHGARGLSELIGELYPDSGKRGVKRVGFEDLLREAGVDTRLPEMLPTTGPILTEEIQKPAVSLTAQVEEESALEKIRGMRLDDATQINELFDYLEHPSPRVKGEAGELLVTLISSLRPDDLLRTQNLEKLRSVLRSILPGGEADEGVLSPIAGRIKALVGRGKMSLEEAMPLTEEIMNLSRGPLSHGKALKLIAAAKGDEALPLIREAIMDTRDRRYGINAVEALHELMVRGSTHALEKAQEWFPQCPVEPVREALYQMLLRAVDAKRLAKIDLPEYEYQPTIPDDQRPYLSKFPFPENPEDLLRLLISGDPYRVGLLMYPLKSRAERMKMEDPEERERKVKEMEKIVVQLANSKGNLTVRDLAMAIKDHPELSQHGLWELFYHYIPGLKGRGEQDIVTLLDPAEREKLAVHNHVEGGNTRAEEMFGGKDGVDYQIGICLNGFDMMHRLLTEHPKWRDQLTLDHLVKSIGQILPEQLEQQRDYLRSSARVFSAKGICPEGDCFMGNRLLKSYDDVQRRIDEVLGGGEDANPLIDSIRDASDKDAARKNITSRILAGEVVKLMPRDMHAARVRDAIGYMTRDGDIIQHADRVSHFLKTGEILTPKQMAAGGFTHGEYSGKGELRLDLTPHQAFREIAKHEARII